MNALYYIYSTYQEQLRNPDSVSPFQCWEPLCTAPPVCPATEVGLVRWAGSRWPRGVPVPVVQWGGCSPRCTPHSPPAADATPLCYDLKINFTSQNLLCNNKIMIPPLLYHFLTIWMAIYSVCPPSTLLSPLFSSSRWKHSPKNKQKLKKLSTKTLLLQR